MEFKRNFIKLYINIAVFSSFVVFSSCRKELEVVQSINEEFSGINQIDIESGFLDVVYLGDPNLTTIQLDALLESSNSGRYRIEVREESGTLEIELDQKGLFNTGRDRGYIYLKGPRLMKMDVEVGSGTATISNVESEEFEVSAGSGKLDIQQVKAFEIELSAGSGELIVNELEGDSEVEVGSGLVRMNGIKGNVKLSGSSGRYQLEQVEGLVNASLNSGNIDLNEVESLGRLEVSSGRVKAVNSGLSNQSIFKASSGSIQIQTFSDLTDFNYSLSANSGKVSVGENSASGNLNIDNGSPYTVSGSVSSGSIEIRN